MKEINVGVVGVGRLGTFHAQKYLELQDQGVRLVALIDPETERVSKKFPGIPVFSNYEAWFAAEDKGEVPKASAASVATNTVFHREVAEALLLRGCNVLVEKPLASSSHEGRDLIAAAARAQKILAVGHVERHRAMESLRRLGTPRFIECHRLAPFSNRSTDIDVVLDLMIHDIDLMLSIVKSPLKFVHAAGFPVLTNKVDIANARFEFADGCVANLTCSRVSIQAMRKFRVFAGDTYLSLDLGAGKFQFFRKNPNIPNPEEAIEGDFGEIEVRDALRTEVGDFISAIREQRKPLVTGEDALHAQILAEKVQFDIEARIKAEAK